MFQQLVESTKCDSIRYSERHAKAGVEPSVGSKGDNYDNALAEAINGLFKAGVSPPLAVKKQRGGRTGHTGWVPWLHNARLLKFLGYIPLADAEVNFDY